MTYFAAPSGEHVPGPIMGILLHFDRMTVFPPPGGGDDDPKKPPMHTLN